MRIQNQELKLSIKIKVDISMWDAIKLRVMGADKEKWDKAFKRLK